MTVIVNGKEQFSTLFETEEDFRLWMQDWRSEMDHWKIVARDAGIKMDDIHRSAEAKKASKIVDAMKAYGVNVPDTAMNVMSDALYISRFLPLFPIKDTNIKSGINYLVKFIEFIGIVFGVK